MHIRSHSPEAAPDRGRSLISTIACSARNEKRCISNSRCLSVCQAVWRMLFVLDRQVLRTVFKPPSLYIPISWGASIPGGRLYTAGRPGRFVLEGTGGRRRRFIFVGRTDPWRWSSTPHCAHLPQPLDRYVSRQPARHVPPAASRTFRIPLLFPGSRRFVYRVRRDAGCRAELLMYVTTGKKGSPYSILSRFSTVGLPVT